jgi:hypothetical protein
MQNEGSKNWNDADGRDAALQKPLQQIQTLPQGKARLEGEPGAKHAAAVKLLPLVGPDPRSERVVASVGQGGEAASKPKMWRWCTAPNLFRLLEVAQKHLKEELHLQQRHQKPQ